MQNYQLFKSRYRALGMLATDKSFTVMRKLCYLLSVIVNLLLLVDVKFQDKAIYLTLAEVPVFVLSVVLGVTSAAILTLWIIGNYSVVWSSVIK